MAKAKSALEAERQRASQLAKAAEAAQADLTGKNAALQSLGAQLLKAREELSNEKQWVVSLKGKVEELSGDAETYAGTISALQAALRSSSEGGDAAAAAVAAAAVHHRRCRLQEVVYRLRHLHRHRRRPPPRMRMRRRARMMRSSYLERRRRSL